MATLTYAKYSNLNNLEAPIYNFIVNPLAYISHQDWLLEAKEAAAVAYTFRAIKETYLTAQRQLSAQELYISKKKYYGLAQSLSGLPSGAKGQLQALSVLKLLLHQHRFKYRSWYIYIINLELSYLIAWSL